MQNCFSFIRILATNDITTANIVVISVCWLSEGISFERLDMTVFRCCSLWDRLSLAMEIRFQLSNRLCHEGRPTKITSALYLKCHLTDVNA